MSLPSRTWESAAAEAACEITSDHTSSGGEGSLPTIEWNLERIRDEDRSGAPDRLRFAWMGDAALVEYVAATTSYPEDARDRALNIVVETIISKQHDYGHENILWGGVQGIVLRMHDKVARIKNLQARSAKPIGEDKHANEIGPIYESLADSWLDLVGYSIIGIMLEAGTFELPLEADVKRVRIPEGFVENEDCENWYEFALFQPGTRLRPAKYTMVGYATDSDVGPSVFVSHADGHPLNAKGTYLSPEEIDRFIDALIDARDAVS